MSSLHLLEILRDPTADAWLRFVERVFGPLGEADGIPEAVLAGQLMPEMLRRYYLRVGRKDLHHQNHFLSPERPELLTDLDIPARQGDKLSIYVENQGNWLWATATEGDDPPVWVEGDGVDGWQIASSHLSEFLLHTLLFEFPFAAPASAWRYEPLPPDELAALLTRFVPIADFGPAPYRFRLLANDDLVLVADSMGYAWVCGTESDRIRDLRLTGSDWDT